MRAKGTSGQRRLGDVYARTVLIPMSYSETSHLEEDRFPNAHSAKWPGAADVAEMACHTL